MKILAAEDSPVTRSILKATLRSFGHEAVMASNGAEAWEQFQKEPVSLILSDWVMPEMDGLELCRNIRKWIGQRANKEYVYFILITGDRLTKEDVRRAMDEEVDDFLTKPIDPEGIWMRLRVAERILGYTRQIGQLKGLLPICMHCKKIRNDENYWEQIEGYIHQHTGTDFSHGICPQCYQEMMKGMALN